MISLLWVYIFVANALSCCALQTEERRGSEGAAGCLCGGSNPWWERGKKHLQLSELLLSQEFLSESSSLLFAIITV